MHIAIHKYIHVAILNTMCHGDKKNMIWDKISDLGHDQRGLTNLYYIITSAYSIYTYIYIAVI